MSTKPLPLDVIQVNEPCTQSWDAMTGDGRVRYCAGCRKHVYDLSAMTRTEAEALVCQAAGELCVRFSRSADGRVLTLDYQRPSDRGRGWRFWTVVTTCAASLAASAGGFVLARTRAAATPPPLMGAMVVQGQPTPPTPIPPAGCDAPPGPVG